MTTLRRLLFPTFALGLLMLAFAPTADATASRLTCWVGTDVINDVDYYCKISGTGAEGNVQICPDGLCARGTYCWIDLTTLTGYCYR